MYGLLWFEKLDLTGFQRILDACDLQLIMSNQFTKNAGTLGQLPDRCMNVQALPSVSTHHVTTGVTDATAVR